MGLGELVARTVVQYRADVTDMRSGLKQLQGDEKALAQAELEAAEARNDQLESWNSGLLKVTATLAAVGGAAKLIWDGYQDGIKDAQAASAAWYVDINKLKTAANGLRTENELVAWSAKLATSAFHNSEQDLVDAQRAMRALTMEGKDQADVTEKVTNALQTLRTKGLTDLGIYVDTSKVKFDANGEAVGDYSNKLELHRKILEALRQKGAEAADGQDALGDSIQRAAVKLQDSWDDLKKGLGQLVTAMQPLLEALATAVGLIAKAADAGGKDIGGEGLADALAAASGGKFSAADIQKRYGFGKGLGITGDVSGLTGAYSYLGGGGAIDDINRVQGQAIVDTYKNYALGELAKLKAYLDAENKKPAKTGGPEKLSADQIHAQILGTFRTYSQNDNVGTGGTAGSLGAAAGETNLIGQNEEMDAAIAKIREQGEAYNEMMANAATAYDRFIRQREDTILEKTFGPVGEFDLYKKAFESLTGAVGSAYDAWASGSESASQAFKKFIGQSVEAVGKQMAVEAVKEGAYALGHLAIGDFGGAAAHATAAAEFAAGAVLAGVVAQQLGAGGGTTAKPAAGGSGTSGTGVSGGGTSGAPQQQTAIIVIGEQFATTSTRQRANEAENLVKRALGGSSLEDS